jgi:uncharacterized protein with HEPN domain
LPPTLSDRLHHILEAIEEIEQALAGKDAEQFAQDRLVRVAVERLLEIISEASRHLPQEVKARAAHIAWRRMADLGNRLRHAYHRVDAGIVWEIHSNDLPPLKAFIVQILREGEGDTA